MIFFFVLCPFEVDMRFFEEYVNKWRLGGVAVLPNS